MPANITDADTFTATVQAPADGDTANGATFQLAPQDLADRTRYLYNRMESLAYGTWGDEAKTLTVGTVWHQTVAATVARVVTLRHSTSPIPKAGQKLRAMGFAADTITVSFKREDATTIAILTGYASAPPFAVEFVYTGTVWVVDFVEQPASATATPWSGLVRY